jgi:hypothetical protein
MVHSATEVDSARTSVSTRSSGTSETSTQREYFKRDAKKCTFSSGHPGRSPTPRRSRAAKTRQAIRQSALVG